jgi:hypothetical protein
VGVKTPFEEDDSYIYIHKLRKYNIKKDQMLRLILNMAYINIKKRAQNVVPPMQS